MGMTYADRHQMKMPVTDTRLGHHRTGKGLNLIGAAAQDDGLDAIVVVKVRMGRRDCQLVVIVLHVHQSCRELALMVVVQVAERCDAGPVRTLGASNIAQIPPEEVAKRLGAIPVAMFTNEYLEGFGQIVVKRHRQSLHSQFPV